MTELERFFRQIVHNLAADPERLRRPMTVAEIRDAIVPYRTNRRALQLESSEEYEFVLLQLCAGEGGFATTVPEEVRALFAAELRSSNPDLEMLHEHESAVVRLEAGPLAVALNPEPGRAFAPPDETTAIGGAEAAAALPDAAFMAQPRTGYRPEPSNGVLSSSCSQCGGLLPPVRGINYGPHCGGQHVPARCRACRAELEAGWKHCISCGVALT